MWGMTAVTVAQNLREDGSQSPEYTHCEIHYDSSDKEERQQPEQFIRMINEFQETKAKKTFCSRVCEFFPVIFISDIFICNTVNARYIQQ